MKLKDLAKMIAPIAANIFLPGSGSLVDKVMRETAKEPNVGMDLVEQKIQDDPALLVEFKKAMMDHEVELAKLDVAAGQQDVESLAIVNTTMQQEAKSEKWAQWMWRPFNGFLFGPTVIYIYAVLPSIGKAVPNVPQAVWLLWGAVLGITAWGRNRLKEQNNLVATGGPGELIGSLIRKVIKK